jgi:hypothetical protein
MKYAIGLIIPLILYLVFLFIPDSERYGEYLRSSAIWGYWLAGNAPGIENMQYKNPEFELLADPFYIDYYFNPYIVDSMPAELFKNGLVLAEFQVHPGSGRYHGHGLLANPLTTKTINENVWSGWKKRAINTKNKNSGKDTFQIEEFDVPFIVRVHLDLEEGDGKNRCDSFFLAGTKDDWGARKKNLIKGINDNFYEWDIFLDIQKMSLNNSDVKKRYIDIQDSLWMENRNIFIRIPDPDLSDDFLKALDSLNNIKIIISPGQNYHELLFAPFGSLQVIVQDLIKLRLNLKKLKGQLEKMRNKKLKGKIQSKIKSVLSQIKIEEKKIDAALDWKRFTTPVQELTSNASKVGIEVIVAMPLYTPSSIYRKLADNNIQADSLFYSHWFKEIGKLEIGGLYLHGVDLGQRIEANQFRFFESVFLAKTIKKIARKLKNPGPGSCKVLIVVQGLLTDRGGADERLDNPPYFWKAYQNTFMRPPPDIGFLFLFPMLVIYWLSSFYYQPYFDLSHDNPDERKKWYKDKFFWLYLLFILIFIFLRKLFPSLWLFVLIGVPLLSKFIKIVEGKISPLIKLLKKYGINLIQFNTSDKVQYSYDEIEGKPSLKSLLLISYSILILAGGIFCLNVVNHADFLSWNMASLGQDLSRYRWVIALYLFWAILPWIPQLVMGNWGRYNWMKYFFYWNNFYAAMADMAESRENN